MLKDRLYHAQGEAAVRPQPPNSSNRVGVSTPMPTPPVQTPAPKAQLMVWSYFLQDDVLMHLVNVWISFKPFGVFFSFSNLRVSTSHPLLSAYSLLYHQFLPHQLLQPTQGLVCHLPLICHLVQPALPWGLLTPNTLLQLQVWIWLFTCSCFFQILRDSKDSVFLSQVSFLISHSSLNLWLLADLQPSLLQVRLYHWLIYQDPHYSLHHRLL